MKVRLSITIAKPPILTPVQGGETISGMVNMAVPQDISGVSNFLLQFMGYEEVQVRYTEYENKIGNNPPKRVTKFDKTTYSLIKTKILPVNEAFFIKEGGKIYAHNYQIPFSFQFPNDNTLPSSVAEPSNSSTYGAIVYCVRATLHMASGRGIFGIGSNKIETQTDLWYRQQPEPIQIVPHIKPPNTTSIGTLLHKHGDISYGAKVLDRRLIRGQAVKLKIVVLNDSRAVIDVVNITVSEATTIQAKGHSSTDSSNLLTHRVRAGLPGKEKAKGTASDEEKEQKKALILKELNKPIRENDPTLFTLPPLPQSALNTYKGKGIQRTHAIKVKLILRGQSYSDISFAIPVRVVETGPAVAGTATAAAMLEPLAPMEPSIASAAAVPVVAVAPSAPTEQDWKDTLPVASAKPIYDLEQHQSTAVAAVSSSAAATTTTQSVSLPSARPPTATTSQNNNNNNNSEEVEC